MVTIFNSHFFTSIFLSISIILVSTPDSSGQIKTRGIDQHKSFFQFEQSVNDSLTHQVTLTRLPEKGFSDKRSLKTSGILATCNTSTFYMHLSATSGQKINLKGLQTLPNGNFILTGNITTASSAQEGMLCIMTNSGILVSQSQVRINGNPVTLFSALALLNGKLVITGTLNDGSNKAFVSLLNTDISTDWVKVFDIPSSPMKATLGLTESNQITFAVQLFGSVMYSLLNMDGTVVWNKEAFPAGLDELIGFNESPYAGYALITNCTRMGKKAVDLLRINPDGTINSSQIIGNGNDENKYDDIKTFNSRVLTLGVVKKGSAQFQLTRDIIGPSANIETEHSYTIPLNIDFNTSSAFDNAGDVMGFCFPQQGKLVFIRHFAYYQTSPEYTREYDVPTGARIVAVARSFTDGGYIFGLNTSNSDELILIKTDSIGVLPGCGYKTISNDYTEILNKQNTIATTTGNSISISSTTGALSNKTVVLNTKFDCNQSYCPPPPVDDTCLSSYFKIYRTSSYAEGFGSYYLMRNNNIIVSFAKYDRILGNSNVLTHGIKLLDEKGHFIKGVNVYCDGVTTSFDLRKIDDRHVMAIFYSVKNGSPCYTFTLINDDLQIVWSRSFETFQNYNFHGIDLTTDTEGNYYFVGNNLGFNENASVLAFKMDSNGNPVWLKIYEIQNGLFLQSFATTTNTSLIVVIEGGFQGSASVRFDKATGEMLNAYSYTNNAGGSIYRRLLQFDKDRIFYAGNDDQGRFMMRLFDTTGKPIKSKYINDLASIPRAATIKSGSLYAIYESYSDMRNHEVLIKVDTSLSIQFSNEFYMLGYPIGMEVSDNGSIYVGGNYVYGGVNGSYYDAYIQKYNNDGTLGTCSYQSVTPELIDGDVTYTSPNFYPVSKSFTPIDI
jgi:hypothetical protein